MSCTHVDTIQLNKLERQMIGGVRHYINEGQDAIAVPSVTTILGHGKKHIIHEWRKRVGAEEANRISKFASTQGTAVHEAIEAHCGNLPLPEPMAPNVFYMFKPLQALANEHIDNIHMIEGQMLSRHLRVAGTVDMIAEWDGVLSVSDWKTSKKTKRKEWVEDYFKQEAAYAVMYEENGGPPVSQLVTAITVTGGDTQVFVEKRDDWIGGFIEARDVFEKSLDLSQKI